jgi:hypothetical protein
MLECRVLAEWGLAQHQTEAGIPIGTNQIKNYLEENDL